MGFLDTLLGRTKPVQPKLDDLFGLPSAAIQLQAATGFTPTGSGSVCFRSVEGKTFADIQKEVRELLDLDNSRPGGGASPKAMRWVTGISLSISRNSTIPDCSLMQCLPCLLIAARRGARCRS